MALPIVGWDTVIVPSFGGGLNFTDHPIALENDQWTWCDGFVARDGYAELLPQYVEVLPGSWSALSPIGIVQNPFDGEYGALVALYNAGTNVVEIWRMKRDGTRVQITAGADTAGGAGALWSDGQHPLAAAFLNGYLILLVGVGGLAGRWGLCRWNGGATYNTIAAVGVDPLSGSFLHSFGNHLVLGGAKIPGGTVEASFRHVKVSDIDSETVWLPAVGNSADFFTLDDASSGLTAQLPIGTNLLGLATREKVYALQPTGGIPPYTRGVLQGAAGVKDFGQSSAPSSVQQGVETPRGTIYLGYDDIYMVGAGGFQGIGSKIKDYILDAPGVTANQLRIKPWVWHPRLGIAIVPAYVRDTGDKTGYDLLLFHPGTGAWSRRTLPSGLASGVWKAQAVIREQWDGTNIAMRERHWLGGTNADLWAEDIAGGAQSGAYVDSKDFAYAEPTRDNYIGRIKVDWEPLTNATTDALTVQIACRNELGKSILGSEGAETQNLTWSTVGTLTAGASELPVRKRGKYARWRFLHSSGRVRIRGFTFLRRKGAPRRT